jgi:peptidyl-prolyl cis-trans isomerase D
MSENFQRKSAKIFAFIFIGIIVLSFVFSGLFNKAPTEQDTLATVGDVPIKWREYSSELNRQTEFYKQIFKATHLTTQQMEQFKIKDKVIGSLVNQKLVVILGKEMGVHPSSMEIVDRIKDSPYFKVENQFSVNLYKSLLQRNGFSPTEYEKLVAEEISGATMSQLLTERPVSKKFLATTQGIKQKKILVDSVVIDNEKLQKYLPITDAEVAQFLKEPHNEKKLQSYFESQRMELDRPLEIKARHILVKDLQAATVIKKTLTKENFAKTASTSTLDPQGKANGGELGWFSQGRMVPEFEAVAFTLKPGEISHPVKSPFGFHLIYVEDRREAVIAKFEDYKQKLAKELIQKSKPEEMKKLAQTLSAEIEQAFQAHQVENVKKIAQKYSLSMLEKTPVTLMDSAIGGYIIDYDKLQSLLDSKNSKTVFAFQESLKTVIVHKAGEAPAAPVATAKADGAEAAGKGAAKDFEEDAFGPRVMADQLFQDIKKHLEEKNKVVIHRQFL